MSRQRIGDVLNRRSDLSTFIVHLTRNDGTRTAREALESIIREGVLRASRPMGWAIDQDDPSDLAKQTQRAVSFSETPLEHIYSLVADIEGRKVRLAPYGVAFTKLVARRIEINPIWYVDMTPGHDWVLSPAINSLRDRAIDDGNFHEQPIARLTPFFELMGTWPDGQKEFWWEREWRHIGDLKMPSEGVLWLCPEEERESLLQAVGQDLAPIIDPRWGLEQIIASLAGFSDADVTPFAPHREDPAVDSLD